MRTTVRIEDDLLRDLKRRAQQDKTSLTKLMNSLLRFGMTASRSAVRRKTPYCETTYSMGVPKVDLTKALALAAELEDQEIIRKLVLGK